MLFWHEWAEIVVRKKINNRSGEEFSWIEGVIFEREMVEWYIDINGGKLFAHEGDLSIRFEDFTSLTSDMFDIGVDILKIAVFVDEGFCLFGTKSRDPGDIVRTIPANGEIIDDVFRIDSEFLSCLCRMKHFMFHRVVDRDIAIDELVEIFISREDEYIVFCIFS
ncbi:MAG: hypothetical protein ACD_78C00263G0002 [uncultured bacterium (gcode 4)]|uniref:Uncharacterized protein n=1 Tax=uncultured bacterium (gcode 4) TaxID=1234023 RepID=K1XHK3_9BACT|nr:MAG: hypothetical protein ACD_78C00263G0002 [uncultured bacterium (gcode 4)]